MFQKFISGKRGSFSVEVGESWYIVTAVPRLGIHESSYLQDDPSSKEATMIFLYNLWQNDPSYTKCCQSVETYNDSFYAMDGSSLRPAF